MPHRTRHCKFCDKEIESVADRDVTGWEAGSDEYVGKAQAELESSIEQSGEIIFKLANVYDVTTIQGTVTNPNICFPCFTTILRVAFEEPRLTAFYQLEKLLR
jgi:hypothetical protein